jgi:uncharacterized domain 1
MSNEKSFEQRVRDSFEKQSFMKTIGAELTSVQQGYVEVRLPANSGLLQQNGFVHAGAVSAIADTAAGYAAMTLLPQLADVLTVEFKINLLSPARGEYLVARGKVIRSGKQLSVSSVDVFAISGGEEKCVATLLATIAHRS